MTDLFDLVRTVWRHPVVALVMIVNVMVLTGIFLVAQTPLYQSTVTLQLAATTTDSNFLAQVNSLTPLYSALLSSPQTFSVAQTDLGSTHLGQISVLTFTDSPVLKVNATSGSASAATASAGAVIRALNQRLNGSKLGAPGVAVAVIDGPSSADLAWPRPALTLGVAAVVAVLLAVFAAWLADRRRPRAVPASEPTPGWAIRPRHAPTRGPVGAGFPRTGGEHARLGQPPRASAPPTFRTPAGTDVSPPSGAVGDVIPR